jgi:hypothetical protein
MRVKLQAAEWLQPLLIISSIRAFDGEFYGKKKRKMSWTRPTIEENGGNKGRR